MEMYLTSLLLSRALLDDVESDGFECAQEGRVRDKLFNTLYISYYVDVNHEIIILVHAVGFA
jgi:hypothetical protein